MFVTHSLFDGLQNVWFLTVSMFSICTYLQLLSCDLYNSDSLATTLVYSGN